MKVRIHNNHLRLRFTRGEVASLEAGNPIEQTLQFSLTSRLITRIEPASVTLASAMFDGVLLVVYLPTQQVQHWATTDQVGIEAVQPVGDGSLLTILIEKDFECLHKDETQTPDTFPNPLR